ncbi:MAG TPA: MaoC family dehydratase [Sedimentibacter sp.]|nr:MaoC family dehydratase [Sedimentibacter sp.]
MFINQTYKKEFLITEEIGREFARVSQDNNPIHLDDDYAKNTKFKGKIAHGMLMGAYISSILGMEFPGEGCIYLSQEISFLRPVHYGDTITIEIKVVEMIQEKNRLILDTNCYNQDGKQVVSGKATVMPKEDQ